MARVLVGTTLALATFVVASCRPPTEIVLVRCLVPGLTGTSVTVGDLGALEAKAPTTSSSACAASGGFGTLVVVLSGGKNEESRSG
jgi:hypothetical protein